MQYKKWHLIVLLNIRFKQTLKQLECTTKYKYL